MAQSTTDDVTKLVLGFVPGTGRMGSALARNHAQVGFKVMISSRDEKKAQETATQLIQKNDLKEGSITSGSHETVIKGSDVIFWCIQAPLEVRKETLQKLAPLFKGKIVVDITNIMYMDQFKDQWGQVSSTTLCKEWTDEVEKKN